MRVPSNLLTVFKNHNGQLEPEDAILEVPRVLLPTVSVPAPVSIQQTGTGTPQLGSVTNSIFITITNDVGSTQELTQLSAGLWEIHVAISFVSNFASVAATAAHIDITLPGGAIRSELITVFAGGAAATPAEQNVERQLTMSLSEVTVIDLTVEATGAGQTSTATGWIYAARLA